MKKLKQKLFNLAEFAGLQYSDEEIIEIENCKNTDKLNENIYILQEYLAWISKQSQIVKKKSKALKNKNSKLLKSIIAANRKLANKEVFDKVKSLKEKGNSRMNICKKLKISLNKLKSLENNKYL